MPAANMSPEVSLSPRKRLSGPKNTEHSHACMPAHFHIPKDLHVSVCCFGTAHKVIHHLELWLPPRTIVMPLPPTLNPETQCYPFIHLLAHAALSGVIAAEELRVGIEKARHRFGLAIEVGSLNLNDTHGDDDSNANAKNRWVLTSACRWMQESSSEEQCLAGQPDCWDLFQKTDFSHDR